IAKLLTEHRVSYFAIQPISRSVPIKECVGRIYINRKAYDRIVKSYSGDIDVSSILIPVEESSDPRRTYNINITKKILEDEHNEYLNGIYGHVREIISQSRKDGITPEEIADEYTIKHASGVYDETGEVFVEREYPLIRDAVAEIFLKLQDEFLLVPDVNEYGLRTFRAYGRRPKRRQNYSRDYLWGELTIDETRKAVVKGIGDVIADLSRGEIRTIRDKLAFLAEIEGVIRSEKSPAEIRKHVVESIKKLPKVSRELIRRVSDTEDEEFKGTIEVLKGIDKLDEGDIELLFLIEEGLREPIALIRNLRNRYRGGIVQYIDVLLDVLREDSYSEKPHTEKFRKVVNFINHVIDRYDLSDDDKKLLQESKVELRTEEPGGIFVLRPREFSSEYQKEGEKFPGIKERLEKASLDEFSGALPILFNTWVQANLKPEYKKEIELFLRGVLMRLYSENSGGTEGGVKAAIEKITRIDVERDDEAVKETRKFLQNKNFVLQDKAILYPTVKKSHEKKLEALWNEVKADGGKRLKQLDGLIKAQGIRSDKQKEIWRVIVVRGLNRFSPDEIAKLSGIKAGSVREALARMAEETAGVLTRSVEGRYLLSEDFINILRESAIIDDYIRDELLLDQKRETVYDEFQGESGIELEPSIRDILDFILHNKLNRFSPDEIAGLAGISNGSSRRILPKLKNAGILHRSVKNRYILDDKFVNRLYDLDVIAGSWRDTLMLNFGREKLYDNCKIKLEASSRVIVDLFLDTGLKDLRQPEIARLLPDITYSTVRERLPKLSKANILEVKDGA
ncbi:MAG: hypothetical protein U9Q22_06030, partial [Candidatus Altiarchaeota archaeon]|nr:hypothetical protein [Candidatus Altiarchaeota archaeon]